MTKIVVIPLEEERQLTWFFGQFGQPDQVMLCKLPSTFVIYIDFSD